MLQQQVVVLADRPVDDVLDGHDPCPGGAVGDRLEDGPKAGHRRPRHIAERDEDGMTKFRLGANEKLEIVVKDSAAVREKAPYLLEELAFCVGGINERYEDYGEKPALALVLR